MVNLNRVVEVGVIDEIQLIACPDRGWAWTRALYGMPARELHVCGDPTALPLLQVGGCPTRSLHRFRTGAL